MPATILGEHAEDIEELVVAWLTPLRNSGVAFQVGDLLPFTLVTHVAGTESPDPGYADPVVSVHTLCAKALGYGVAKTQADQTHRRMLQLARHSDIIPLAGARNAGVDYITVTQSPLWVPYEDNLILRKVARYQIGLSYVATT